MIVKEPPMCPECGTVLDEVYADGRTTWVYEDGHYHTFARDDVTLRCPSCGACLDDLFKMGIYYWGLE